MKAYPDKGPGKFLAGGKSAVFGETPKLKPYAFDAPAYDAVILGAPVWAGRAAAPIKTFAKENRAALAGKRLSVFVCSLGGGVERAFSLLAQTLGVPGFAQTLSLIEPKARPEEETERKIEDFCARIASI